MKPPSTPTRPALRAVILLWLGAVLLPSCSVYLPTHRASNEPQPPLYEWRGDGMQGPTTVRIHLHEQKAYIFRNGQEAGWTRLASGTERHPTPNGSFSIMEKVVDKVSNTYGVIMDASGAVVNNDAQAGVTPVPAGCRFVGSPMPYWMRLTSYGVGMHAGEIPDPGYPASHGCIRLPRPMAETLFSIVHEGTPVTITGRAPLQVPVLAGPTKRSTEILAQR